MHTLLEEDNLPTDLIDTSRNEYRQIKHNFLKYIQNPNRFVKKGVKPPPPRTAWEILVKNAYREAYEFKKRRRS